ncbi:MAG: hypothetical protein KatS3mg124_0159 [Porticoccaceae bacterium]|nr:MAG: hypothetical protein KatS3mg124_0159 [Porticoccaceae bacterium]
MGIHIHTPAPLDFLRSRGHDPADFAPEERAHLEKMRRFNAEETGYMRLQCTKPMTPAVALHDSPAGPARLAGREAPHRGAIAAARWSGASPATS